eukprot:517192-Rhodomonas_salina.1
MLCTAPYSNEYHGLSSPWYGMLRPVLNSAVQTSDFQAPPQKKHAFPLQLVPDHRPKGFDCGRLDLYLKRRIKGTPHSPPESLYPLLWVPGQSPARRNQRRLAMSWYRLYGARAVRVGSESDGVSTAKSNARARVPGAEHRHTSVQGMQTLGFDFAGYT